MAKYVAQPIGTGFGAQSNLNQNFEDIEDNFQRVLYRDGSTPNQMESDLDMNSNDIYNVNNINTTSLAINGQQVVANETFVTPLPDPTGQAGKYIRSDGVSASWRHPSQELVMFVDTIAAMKAMTGLSNGAIIACRDNSVNDDGGFTFFRYRSTPIGTSDEKITFAQTTGGGQFENVSDFANVLQTGVKRDGVSDGYAAATDLAETDRSFYVPDGEYELSQDAYINGTISPKAKYTGDGKFITIESVLELTKQFFVQQGTDAANNTVPNYFRRATERRRPDSSYTYETTEVYERTPNSTALGLAVQFLSMYAIWEPNKKSELIPYIEAGADYLIAMQYRDTATARYGGFRLASNDGSTTCFGAGTCGTALLKAYKATGNPNYLTRARVAATYLQTLADPNTVYGTLYGETPIPAVPENAGFTGFCDRIQPNDTINITASNWNLVAAAFLKELYEVTGTASYLTLANNARDFHDFGTLNGLDYFAIKNAAPSSKVSVTWPFFSGHTYADGAWHRLGEPAGTNTVGTDQIEYGLASLYKLGYSTATLDTAYQVYRDLVHADFGSTSFGNAYDGAICFTGFFRINSTVYGGAGGNGTPIHPGTSRAFGGYYDLQGTGTLLKFKYDRHYADYIKSIKLNQLAYKRGALVDENFDTRWSTATDYEFYTKGIIPIAKAGIGILETLGV